MSKISNLILIFLTLFEISFLYFYTCSNLGSGWFLVPHLWRWSQKKNLCLHSWWKMCNFILSQFHTCSSELIMSERWSCGWFEVQIIYTRPKKKTIEIFFGVKTCDIFRFCLFIRYSARFSFLNMCEKFLKSNNWR